MNMFQVHPGMPRTMDNSSTCPGELPDDTRVNCPSIFCALMSHLSQYSCDFRSLLIKIRVTCTQVQPLLQKST